MAAQGAQVQTETLTTTAVQDAAKAALDGVNKLKARATATLGEEFQAIAKAARHDDGHAVSLRLERHNTMSDLAGTVAWLARDLVDVLLKVATGNEPHAVMASDLATRIRRAETRLELLREMSR